MGTQGHSPNVPTRPIRLCTPTKIALTVSRCPGYPAPSHGVSVRSLVRKYDPAESAPSPPPCLLRGGARTYDCPVHGFHDHNADNVHGSGMVPAERALRANHNNPGPGSSGRDRPTKHYTDEHPLCRISPMTRSGLERLPSTFTYAQAVDAGLSHHWLYSLRDTGALEQVGRGLYRKADAELTDLDLLEVATRAPGATICLLSALARMPYPLDTTSRCLATNGIRGSQGPSNGTASRQRRLTSGGKQFRSTTPRPSACIAPPGPSWTPTACGTRPARMSPTRRYAGGFMAVASQHN